MNRERLDAELRRVRRPQIPRAARERVLAAAAQAAPSEATGHVTVVRPLRSWRTSAVVAAALILVVMAGVWNTRRVAPPGPPQAVDAQPSQVIQPPGDDTVVFWLDDETPVFVELER